MASFLHVKTVSSAGRMSQKDFDFSPVPGIKGFLSGQLHSFGNLFPDSPDVMPEAVEYKDRLPTGAVYDFFQGMDLFLMDYPDSAIIGINGTNRELS